jgi:hypothetical protein
MLRSGLKTEADYLPVAARIAWFRKDHPYWSIITEVEQLADKAIVMKAIIKDVTGAIIATARKKETDSHDLPSSVDLKKTSCPAAYKI